MPISDTPMTYLEFRAIRAQVLRELKLKPTDWIQLLASNIDSAGQPQELLNTSGQITEVSASTISSRVLNNGYYLFDTENPTIGPPITSVATAYSALHHRIAVIPLTEAGGSIGATNVVAALAGYYGVVDRCWIWSPQTDAASTWTFASTTGVTGINGVSIQVAANQTTELVAGVPNVSGANCPLVVYGTADNEVITLAAAGLPAVGTTYYAVIEYHYET